MKKDQRENENKNINVGVLIDKYILQDEVYWRELSQSSNEIAQKGKCW